MAVHKKNQDTQNLKNKKVDIYYSGTSLFVEPEEALENALNVMNAAASKRLLSHKKKEKNEPPSTGTKSS